MSYTLVLQPDGDSSYDTEIYSAGYSDLNYGGEDYLNAGCFLANENLRSLLKFDLTGLPDGAIVTSAIVRLRVEAEGSGTNLDVSFHRALVSWFEGTLSGTEPGVGEDGSVWDFRNHNGSLAWGAAGGLSGTDYVAAATDTTEITGPGAYFEWDVTSDIQLFTQSNAQNYGWFIINEDESTANTRKSFYSSDYETAEYRPRLTITYEIYTYNLEIDWNADGIYTSESLRLMSFQVRRGRNSTLSATGLEQPDPGELIAVLDNYDERFDPYNAGSTIYGYVMPNRKVRLSYNDEDGNRKFIFVGTVMDIRPSGIGYTVIKAIDDLFFLGLQNCSNIILKTDIRASAAILLLIQEGGWGFAGGDAWVFPTILGVTSYLGSALVSDNGDEIPYWWSNPDQTTLQALHDIARAFGGTISIKADGTFCYTTRAGPGYTTMTITQSEMLKDISLVMPWDELYNSIRVAAVPRSQTAANTVIWSLGGAEVIPMGTHVHFWAEYSYNGERCPALSIVNIVDPTDFTYTGSVNSTAVNTPDYATESYITVTEVGGIADCTITLLQMRGVLLAGENKTFSEASDATSITNYGISRMVVSSPWIQSAAWALEYAAWLLAFAKDHKSILEVTIEGRPEYQYTPDLMSKLHIEIDKKFIDDDFLVGKIEHTWEAGGRPITKFRLEPI